MNILVTGAGGFLGSGIVRELCKRGESVRSLERGNYQALKDLGVDKYQGDIADLDTVIKASKGCDMIFHVAAKAGAWGNHRDYYQSNVVGTKNILEACRENKIPRLVYTSSPSVVFDGEDEDGIDESAPYSKNMMSHYQRTKAEAEKSVLEANSSELATVALRPHLMFGPGDPHIAPRIIQRAKKGRLRLVGKRRNLVDITYIDNAVAAHLSAMDSLSPGASCAGKAYFISNGEPLPMAEIVNRILAAAHLPAITKTVSPNIAYMVGIAMEAIYSLFRIKAEPFMTRLIAKQLECSHWFDISAAKRDIGYKPTVSIDEGMRRLEQALIEKHSAG